MSQNERRQALGRRESDFEAAALHQKVAEHESLFVQVRSKLAQLDQEMAAVLALLNAKDGPHKHLSEIAAVMGRIEEIEKAMRILL